MLIGKNINETIKMARDEFELNGIDSPWLDAELLLADVIKFKREEVLTRGYESFPDEYKEKWAEVVSRRVKREPVDRILGRKRFRKLDVFLKPNIFSPRYETEEVLSRALERIPENGNFLDLCCGTGCIGISIANERKCSGILCDIDDYVVEHCRSEIKRLVPNSKLKAMQSNLFSNIKDKFDLIVSNPPYISTNETENLPPEVLDFDPKKSLFCGEDGLSVCRKIIEESPVYLNKGGWLILEFGFCQKEDPISLFSSEWTNIKKRKPWGAPRSEKEFYLEAQWSPS